MSIEFKQVRPAIVCKDGTTLSVQASRSHYSTPREDDGPYIRVEVGYPSVVPPLSWKEYSDCGECRTDTVYGYVPVKLVEAFIAEHGGIDLGKSI